MIRKGACLLFILLAGIQAKAQDIDSIYSFINRTIHMSFMESSDVRSDWGIFFLNTPYTYDTALCSLMSADRQSGEAFSNVPEEVLKEFCAKCSHIDTGWQRQFRWDQNRIDKFIVVKGYKNIIKKERLSTLLLDKRERRAALIYIKEWNSSSVADRLVNYSGIPLFTDDGRYALVVRGQNAGSSGWDSLFIYLRTETGWKILDSIRLSVI